MYVVVSRCWGGEVGSFLKISISGLSCVGGLGFVGGLGPYPAVCKPPCGVAEGGDVFEASWVREALFVRWCVLAGLVRACGGVVRVSGR